MKILLTGSKGYVGSHLLQHLKAHQVYTIDKSDGNDLLTCDLNYDVDVVIHLAGSANVRDSLENPTKYWTNNVQNSKRLFDAFPNTRILYASSSTAAEPWANPYALSKKAMEMIAPPHALGMRFTTVYGPGGRPDMLIPRILRNELKYANINFSRDFIHVKDLVRAIENLLECDWNIVDTHAYNLASQSQTTILELIELINNSIEKQSQEWESVQPNFETSRQGDIMHSLADISKISSTLNWQPAIELTQGIEELVRIRLNQ